MSAKVRVLLEFLRGLNHLLAHLALKVLGLVKAPRLFLSAASFRVNKFYILIYHDHLSQLDRVSVERDLLKSHQVKLDN